MTGGFDANGQAKEDIEAHHEECEEGDVDDSSISVAMCITLLVGITVVGSIREVWITKYS